MSEPSRVLLCSFEALPGPTGTSRRFTEYVKALSGRFDVTLLGVKRPDVSHIERYHGARLLRVPLAPGDFETQLLSFERALRRQLESEEYALIHFTDPFSGAVLGEQRRDARHRLVYDAQAFPSVEYPEIHPELAREHRLLARARRQELFCLMSADAVVVGSDLTRAYVERLGVASSNVHVLRAPVDLQESAAARARPPDRVPATVVYLGNLAPWQGLPTLLRAVALARARVPLSLRIIGPDHPHHGPALRALAAELGIEDAVEHVPALTHAEVAGALAETDIAVAPLERSERNESQGGELAKLSDYLAAGRPIVAADLPLGREALPLGGALFYRPGDAQALCERLVELALDPGRRVALGQACASAAQHIDAGVIRGGLLQLYRSLLGGAGTGEEAVDDDDEGATLVSAAPLTDPTLPVPTDADPQTVVAPLPVEPSEQTEVGAPPPPPVTTSDVGADRFWQAMALHGHCPPTPAAKSEAGQRTPPPLLRTPGGSKP